MKKISVVIPTFNSWNTVKPCIESIKNQTLKPVEIVIIDNASTDGTSTRVKKIFPKIRLITLKKNTGVTGGRNKGIEVANKKSDYIFFFDHDMIAKAKMLEELVAVAKLRKDIGIVTPKIYYLSDKKRIWSAGTGVNLWTGQVLFRGGKDVGQYDEVEEVQVAPAAMLIKKKVINKIGSFDDKIFAVWEDTDFCFRARKNGYKVMYAPKAVAYHDLSTNPDDEADRLLGRAYWLGRNRVYFMKDFGKSFPLFLLFLPVYFLYYLRLAIRRGNMSGWFSFVKGVVDGIF